MRNTQPMAQSSSSESDQWDANPDAVSQETLSVQDLLFWVFCPRQRHIEPESMGLKCYLFVRKPPKKRHDLCESHICCAVYTVKICECRHMSYIMTNS